MTSWDGISWPVSLDQGIRMLLAAIVAPDMLAVPTFLADAPRRAARHLGAEVPRGPGVEERLLNQRNEGGGQVGHQFGDVLLLPEVIRHGHGGQLRQTQHQRLLPCVEDNLGGEPVVENQSERLSGAGGREEVALLLQRDLDLQVELLPPRLHPRPVLQVSRSDQFEPILAFRLILTIE